MKPHAVIDCGSNTFNLLVGKISDGKLQVIHSERRPVLLQASKTANGEISGAGCQRAVDTLHEYKNIADRFEVEELRCLATSVFRKATNGNALTDRIKTETGIDIEVISGENEAEFIFQGIKSTDVLSKGVSLIMDIGGGSTEFVLSEQGDRLHTWSFEIGATRLIQEIQPSDPFSQRDIIRSSNFIQETIAPMKEILKHYRINQLVGASGFFDTLGDLEWSKTDLSENLKPVSLVMERDVYTSWREQLMGLTIEQRSSWEHIPLFRASLLPMGFCLVDTILQETGINTVICSSHALKEGALIHYRTLWEQEEEF
jgi:exopolyphosphatase / guanosine-5'-triphosphate,3'-diphosphate pyrophosphatase